MAFVYWLSDGAGDNVPEVATLMMRWIRSHGSPALIVYGGDVYDDGKPTEFGLFFDQMDRDMSLLCETPGNHDYNTHKLKPRTGLVPAGYEEFWKKFHPPKSQQPIDATKKGGARYEHFIDLEGWRLIFLDTGRCKDEAWPMSDPGRLEWLKTAVASVPGRSKIVFAHHSRLSRGRHGDNPEVAKVWEALFDDETGAPLVAFTQAGHDHNVSLYGPRPKTNPESGSVSLEKGIHIFVNGAGGAGLYPELNGTKPDLKHDADNFCVTRINLIDASSADVEVLSFGSKPKAPPVPIPGSLVKFKF